MNITEISVDINSGGLSTSIVLSATSAQGPVVAVPTNGLTGVPVPCVISPDVVCWVRKGVSPTAVVDVDTKLNANQSYRIQLLPGERLAVISAVAGTMNFTPNA